MKREREKYLAWAAVNLGIILLTATTLYVTKSLWALLGLFFLFGMKSKSIGTTCPRCGHEFVAVEKDDAEEDD